MRRPCYTSGCTEPAHPALRYCEQHLAARFWAKVDKTETCWLWTSNCNMAGYGRYVSGTRDGKPGSKHITGLAHRRAYELLVGPVPEGLELDHLCRVRHCVNPAHLEPVTHIENMRRSAAAVATHCRNGHPFDDENTYVVPLTARRRCKVCVRQRDRIYRDEIPHRAVYVPEETT